MSAEGSSELKLRIEKDFAALLRSVKLFSENQRRFNSPDIIEEFRLFRRYGFIIIDYHFLVSDINQYLAAAPLEEQESLKLIQDGLYDHVTYLNERMFSLAAEYQATSSDVLAVSPELLRWVDPFLHPQEGVSPLATAVENLRLHVIQCHKRYRSEIATHFAGLKERAQELLDETEVFETACEGYLGYGERINLVSEFCMSTLKNIQIILDELSHYIEVAHDCIRAIDHPDEARRMGLLKTLNLLGQMKVTLTKEVDAIYPVMAQLTKHYVEYEQWLSPRAKCFMAPWLEGKLADPLSASIEALNKWSAPVMERDGKEPQPAYLARQVARRL